jgi:predicted lipid-binding transport protein (Tim44 family)
MSLDPITVIFAALAVFVVWKLRSVLGERTGFEQQPGPGAFAGAAPAQPAPAVDDARWADLAERGGKVWSGLDELAQAQPGFDPRAFLDGAKEAYKMVVQAFSAGDEATLRTLTSDEVFGSFKAALADRAAKGESLTTTFVGFNDVKIADVAVDQVGARISVRFDADFISATMDRAGVLVEGDPEKASTIVDIWTFGRRNDASGPNWTLFATSPTH